jgi:hypothetical protein
VFTPNLAHSVFNPLDIRSADHLGDPSLSHEAYGSEPSLSGLSLTLSEIRTLLRLISLNHETINLLRLRVPDPSLLERAHQAKREAKSLSLRLIDLIGHLSKPELQALMNDLSHNHDVPSDLIGGLCQLPAELCVPLLKASPQLDEIWLHQIIRNTTPSKLRLIATRQDLTASLIDALLDHGPDIGHVLLNNKQAKLKPLQLDLLCEWARHYMPLRLSLIRHPAMGLSQALYLMRFVGSELKAHLTERFGPQTVPDETFVVKDKIHILSRLQHHDFKGFCRSLAEALNLKTETLVEALNGRSYVPLALAFTALGVDRASFEPSLRQIQALNSGKPVTLMNQRSMLRAIFDLGPETAKAKLLASLASSKA